MSQLKFFLLFDPNTTLIIDTNLKGKKKTNLKNFIKFINFII